MLRCYAVGPFLRYGMTTRDCCCITWLIIAASRWASRIMQRFLGLNLLKIRFKSWVWVNKSQVCSSKHKMQVRGRSAVSLESTGFKARWKIHWIRESSGLLYRTHFFIIIRLAIFNRKSGTLTNDYLLINKLARHIIFVDSSVTVKVRVASLLLVPVQVTMLYINSSFR